MSALDAAVRLDAQVREARAHVAALTDERNSHIRQAVEVEGIARTRVADALGVSETQVRHILAGRSGGYRSPRR